MGTNSAAVKAALLVNNIEFWPFDRCGTINLPPEEN
jgi:hypothetical protein